MQKRKSNQFNQLNKSKAMAIGLGILIIAALWGPIMSEQVEQPAYEVIQQTHSIEIRQYVPTLVAEVRIQGERKEAIGDGFRILADYIFGNNQSKQKVAMTSPVEQAPETSEKIAMTSPVTQTGDGQTWQVRFTMPSEYTLETLPTPNNPQVKIIEVPAKKVAVIKFSGLNKDKNIQTHKNELEQFISQTGLKVLSSASYAFYNPPWTLPFMRRNEVMIEVK